MKHLGGGVCLFPSVVESDWDFVFKEFSNAVLIESQLMYKEVVDVDTGELVYENRSGYIFPRDSINKMPGRGSSVHQTDNHKLANILDLFEQAKDQCLLEYLLMFPLAYKNIWWKIKGHVVSYDSEHSQYLGEHSDTSADYVYGREHPHDQLATRNTVSAIVYVNNGFLDGTDADAHAFEGGIHAFGFLGIDYVPHRGDILLFPSNYVASHEVTPVTRGKRISYLGWYSHGSPNPKYNESIVDPQIEPEMARRCTNVYMPNLRQDFIAHIKANSHKAHKDALIIASGENL